MAGFFIAMGWGMVHLLLGETHSLLGDDIALDGSAQVHI
jgi:hypothetical protein